MKKTLIVLLIFLAVFSLTSLYFFKYKNVNSERKNITTSDNVDSKKMKISFVDIGQGEYYSKREKYYIETKIKEADLKDLSRVKKENNCFSFYSKDNQKSDINLCNFFPETLEEDVSKIKRYKISYLEELGGYFISEIHYESSKYFLLNFDYPYSLKDSLGDPVFSFDKKYFFTIGNEFNRYGVSSGLEVWNIVKRKDNTITFSKIASYSSEFFGDDEDVGVNEGFWVDDEIYIKISSIYPEIDKEEKYLKLIFNY